MPNRALRLVLLTLLAGCDERERLTFPSNEPAGPVTTIEVPAADTVLTAGDQFILGGRTVDPDGIDTVYFEVIGTGQVFSPSPGHGDETVGFGLPIVTEGRSGFEVIVQVYAVDLDGNRGETARRQLSVQ